VTPIVATVAQPDPTTTTAAPETTTTAAPETTTTVASVDSSVDSTAPHNSPTGPDDVQIGDALVIERGVQPPDQSTQIGDAVTYER
jgi:hypothetical protein